MIQHLVREECDDNVFLECGEVIDVEMPNKIVKRTLYQIKYNSEPDKLWYCPLLVYIENGDVILV